MDEDGIPADADGRVRIAEKIIKTAEKFGIKKKDIVIDALAMTISSEPEGAKVTLETLRRLRDEIGVNTVLGVSNISFGLPCRPIVNAAFYTMAMLNGLSAGIINPSSEDMMKSWYAYHALMNLDNNCEQYIQKYANSVVSTNIMKTSELSETKLKGENDRSRKSSSKMTLQEAIEKGLRDDAGKITTDMIATEAPLDIINEELIPALNHVGDGFEKGTVFLASASDECGSCKIRIFCSEGKEWKKDGEIREKKGRVILATVKGDIHDIGKNIVKVLLENYSFDVIDLGKDVSPEKIVETACEKQVPLVGLSALMTTTVVSMEETIKMLREKKPDCKVMVGGAVLNQEYADMIGADFYGKDAMQSVHYAEKIFKDALQKSADKKE